MWWRVLVSGLTLLVAVEVAANATAPEQEHVGWSEPIFVGETSVAAPPALIAAFGRLHLFWLDRRGDPIVLLYSAFEPDGVIRVPTFQLATGVDREFGWPEAAAIGSRIVVVWMTRGRGGVELMATVLAATGEVIKPPFPLAPAADESGSIAILPEGDRVHVAWSQFDHGQRRLWYLQMTADGTVPVPPRPVGLGESPTLVAGAPVEVIWWESIGFDVHRLRVSALEGGVLTSVRPLTGPIPGGVSPALATAGPDGLDVFFRTVERGFGTREQLYHVRLGDAGPLSRQLLLPSGSVSEVAGTVADGRLLVVWTAPVGRTRHLEVFAGRFESRAKQLDGVDRVTYTSVGSRYPTLAAGEAAIYAAWLEVAGVNRFRLAFASTLHPRRTWFLLGVPELDAFHPGRLVAFSGAVVLSTLPYVMVYVVAYMFLALTLAALSAAFFGSSRWNDAMRERPGARLALFLLVVLILESASRVVILGEPGTRTLVGTLAGPGVLALRASRAGYLRQTLPFWVACLAILFVQFLMVFFPWGAHQLSQS